MEHKFYTDNFERLLKEKSDEFRMYPSKRVWHSIYNDLHPDRKWPSITVSLLLVSILFLIGYWNSSADKKTTAMLIAQADAATKKVLENNNTPTPVNSPTFHNAVILPEAQPTSATGNYRSGTLAYNKNSSSKTTAPGNKNFTVSSIQTHTSAKLPALNNQSNALIVTVNNNPVVKYTEGEYGAVKAAANHNASQTTETEKTFKVKSSSAFAVELTNKAEETVIAANDNINNPAPLSSAEEKNTGSNKSASEIKKSVNGKSVLSAEDKSWIEHYALYNKNYRRRWKGRLSSEIYFTPSVGYRTFTSNTNAVPAVPAAFTTMVPPNTLTPNINHKPAPGFEAGIGFSYSLAKNLRVKAGIQANFTNYTVSATQINHPVTTTIMLNDLNSGYTYLESRSSTLANIPGINTHQVHNQTYQLSLPVGLAVKLASKEKLEWYAGAAIQPTYILGGKTHLISADHNNYVVEPSLMRRWGLNGGFETYFQYKLNNIILQAGPQLRYQFTSTYSKQYTYNEKLYNVGLKLGLVKNF
jgi:hypothetical protein